jgi:hypothetical protein
MSTAFDTEPATAKWLPPDPIGRGLMAKFFRARGNPTRLAWVEFCAVEERTGSD